LAHGDVRQSRKVLLAHGYVYLVYANLKQPLIISTFYDYYHYKNCVDLRKALRKFMHIENVYTSQHNCILLIDKKLWLYFKVIFCGTSIAIVNNRIGVTL